MKAIFKIILGMIVITTLFMIIGILIQLYVPVLQPIAAIAKGLLIIILVMGFIIISKETIDLISSNLLKRKR
ncbi:MAG: hypothetical protein GY908_09825 [Flavobacteriales bacterium]|nr:hypothetical protein [Flavobacteriales bacterium]